MAALSGLSSQRSAPWFVPRRVPFVDRFRQSSRTPQEVLLARRREHPNTEQTGATRAQLKCRALDVAAVCLRGGVLLPRPHPQHPLVLPQQGFQYSSAPSGRQTLELQALRTHLIRGQHNKGVAFRDLGKVGVLAVSLVAEAVALWIQF